MMGRRSILTQKIELYNYKSLHLYNIYTAMIEQSTNNPCVICSNHVDEPHKFHDQCYATLYANGFKVLNKDLDHMCFICYRTIGKCDPYSTYQMNNFVRFHPECLEQHHSVNGCRHYKETVFNLAVVDIIDKYYVSIDNTFIPIILNSVPDHHIVTDSLDTIDGPFIGYGSEMDYVGDKIKIVTLIFMIIIILIVFIFYIFR
jgi:hypothetical protein